jgi:glycosyltransferase involved in cell wall biosynthesis
LRLLVLGPVHSVHTLDIALAMRARGYDVHLAGAGSAPDPPAQLDGTGIGVTIFSIYTRGAPSTSGILARVRGLRNLAHAFRPEVVHAHVLSSDPFFAAVVGLGPLVATAWGSDVMLASRTARWRNRFVAKRADALTADSASLAGKLVSLGAPVEHVHIVNWGVDLEEFSRSSEPKAELRRRLGLPDGRYILSARAHMPIYNIDVVLASFASLADRDPTVRLLLKHDGKTPLPEFVRRHEDRIHRFGFVELSELIDYYRVADVSVSIPSSDSSPRTVWESMGCGCPTIVSDLDWTEGMITPEVDALVVEIAAEPLAAAIERVLDDDELAHRLSDAGRRLVEAHHDRATQMNRLSALYGALTDGRGGAS